MRDGDARSMARVSTKDMVESIMAAAQAGYSSIIDRAVAQEQTQCSSENVNAPLTRGGIWESVLFLYTGSSRADTGQQMVITGSSIRGSRVNCRNVSSERDLASKIL